MKSTANMLFNLMVTIVVVLVNCGQQGSLIADQNVASTPSASKDNLPYAEAREAAFSLDESKLVTWQRDWVAGWMGGGWSEHREIQVWDLESNVIISQTTFGGNSAPIISTCIPVFDPTGKHLAFSDRSRGRILIWDTSSGKEVITLSLGQDALVKHLKFLPHENLLIALGPQSTSSFEDDIIRVWNTSNWEEMTSTVLSSTLMTFPTGRSAIPFLFDNGNLLVTWNQRGAYEYHDLTQSTRISAITSIHDDFRKLDDRHFSSPISFTFDNASIQAHAHTYKNHINSFRRLEYELKTGQLRGQQSIQVPGEVIGCWLDRKRAPSPMDIQIQIDSIPLSLHSNIPTDIFYRITSNRLIKDGDSVFFVDGATLEKRYTLKGTEEELHLSKNTIGMVNLDVYKDYYFLPHVSQAGAVVCYRQDASGLHQVAIHETKSPVLDLVRSRSGKLIAAICGNVGTNSVVVISLPAVKEQAVFNVQGSISSAAISEDDALVAVGLRTGSDNLIYIYDCRTGEHKRSLRAPDYIHSVAFTPDSTSVVAGGGLGEHYVWSLENEGLPEVLRVDGAETIFDPISGKVVDKGQRTGLRSEGIAVQADGRSFGVLHEFYKPQFVEWNQGKQESLFCFNQPMKFLRTDYDNANIAYVLAQRLPGNPLRFNLGGVDRQMYPEHEIAALDLAKKKFVKRFSTRFIIGNGQLFDVEPKSGWMLGTQHRDGQLAPILLANGSTGKIEYSVDTSLQYVNDAVCLPQGLFIVGGHMAPNESIEIVELKSGTTIKQLENQSLLSFGSSKGFNYLITRESFPKSDKLNFWRLEDVTRFASVSHVGFQRVVISPSEERVASISGDAISVWSVQQLKEGLEKK